MTDERVLRSTYRLQLHAGFGFADAEAIVPYLERLGISHIYLSPILQAAPGSAHGYDVVDHTRVSEELGGTAGLVALAETAHAHGLGLVVDVVPNHMAVPAPEHLNRPFWEMLRLGRDAPTAHWFDVDRDAGDGRVGLPFLGAPLEDVIAQGELSIGECRGEPVLRYGDHRFPLAPGGDTSDLTALLAQQHYALASWRDKDSVLNYRRFFDVDTLAAIRVELDDVFDATHAVLLDLHRQGVIDGFRIDHPDGLADPQAYLERLHEETAGAWVVVEKILAPGESLPAAWQTAGTTGYDALRAIQAAMVPPVGTELDERWRAAGGEPSLERVEREAKGLVVRSLFEPEVQRLAAAAVAATDGALDRDVAAEALRELLSHVEVYRAYLRPGFAADPEELARLARMAELARHTRPDLGATIDVLERSLGDTMTANAAGRDLIVRFQQVCGPVMAKGIEDTTFYRWHRLIALDEVGGDPRSLDAPDSELLHAWAREQADRHPLGMTTLSTHDTKRSEDVRARLLALAEDLDGWDAAWEAVRRHAAEYDVDEPTAYLLFQTLLGAWPLERDRLVEYMEKATHESKQFTSWDDPDERYESRVGDFAARCLEGDVAETFARVVEANAGTIRAVTLGTKLIQLTLPGVADVYQGNEIVEPSLVDPDNRRPVDFAQRAAMLDADAFQLGADLGRDKLWVTSRALRLRRERPDAFGPGAGYEPLASSSPHALGFVRGGRVATVVTRWPGMLARTGWRDHAVTLPPGIWNDILSGTTHVPDDGRVACDALLATLPVALLVKAGR
ncbi:MAG: (1-_4)-alpha-D-glucan 1-alpha-D-glucosylmutase [Gaiellales bacterium]|nr:(1->4)-alpha-D-glucan 1-alpha-D-glucosylmutase [Gaiellales bacterium]